jgi:hypothetical protein
MLKTSQITLAYQNVVLTCCEFFRTRIIWLFIRLLQHKKQKQKLQPKCNWNHWYGSVKKHFVSLSVTPCRLVRIYYYFEEYVATSVMWRWIIAVIWCACMLVTSYQIARCHIECNDVSVLSYVNMKFQKCLLQKSSHWAH